ncbi:MAG: hypothetical protein AAGD25_16060 [Cyanobacteria bacterium P01_F01_bin.150]
MRTQSHTNDSSCLIGPADTSSVDREGENRQHIQFRLMSKSEKTLAIRGLGLGLTDSDRLLQPF